MKRRITAALAALMTALSAGAFSANAVAMPYISESSEEYKVLTDEWEKIDSMRNNSELRMEWYFNGRYVKALTDRGVKMDVYFKTRADRETAVQIIEEMAPELMYQLIGDKIDGFPNGIEPYILPGIQLTDMNSDEAFARAEALCRELQENCDVVNFEYLGHLFDQADCYFKVPGEISYTESDLRHNNVTPGDIRRCIEENNLSVTLVEEKLGENDTIYTLRPDGDMTFDEQIAVANRILDDTGAVFYMVSPTDMAAYSEIEQLEIAANIEGDSNCDGALTIADAAAVLQHLSNRDKYQLTMQGEYNADVNGGGITTSDAVDIQLRCVNGK